MVEQNVSDKYDWKIHFIHYFPTGSKHVCSPPVLDTDEDWCVYTTHAPQARKILLNMGFEHGGSYSEEGESFRKGDINIILIPFWSKFKLWKIATALAKRFNLKEKDDRVALFEAVVRRNPNFKYEKKMPEDWM